MEIYLVGGAVRDRLLGRPVTERDYVVVGATPERMLALGYRQVGRDFPVFLHPDTAEEYALARTERRNARRGGAPMVHADPAVSLRDDLSRRDLTINALAEGPDGALIDYFGGLQDLRQRRLRHVSPAFAEDPIRVLRLARFMARYGELDFRPAPETLALIRTMVGEGRLEGLVPERVWQELVKALGEPRPDLFVSTLRQCGALAVVFPELERLWGVPQPERWHPEIDTGLHTLMVLRGARLLSDDPAVLFAALTHDLGKGETPMVLLPRHHGHEERSVRLVEGMCARLRAPARFCSLAKLAARYHGHIHRAQELRSGTVLRVLEAADAFRRPQRLEALLLACEADYRGRRGFEDQPYPQADLFRQWQAVAAAVDSAAVARACARPELIGEALARERIAAIAAQREAATAPVRTA
jgi:tRNA nucleotidyltransferase (CCA-adding enzyme)